jgi:hypothetical protein
MPYCLKKKVAALDYKNEITAVGIRCADYATPVYLQKLALSCVTSGGRSVGIVRSRTKAMEVLLPKKFLCYGYKYIHRFNCNYFMLYLMTMSVPFII